MSAWLSSPYRAIGIYIGGSERGCAQPNLTASWVSQQYTAGWRFFPFYVGPQAFCGQIDSPPTTQASEAASDAVTQAEDLGFGSGAPIYYDMDSSVPGCSGPANSESLALQFLADWTSDLHALGYKSGVYGSAEGYVGDLAQNYSDYTMPDFINVADYNDECSTTSDPYIPANEWANHQRIHQCEGDVDQTYGGVELGIDVDYADVLVHGATSAGAGVPRAAVYDQDTGNFEVYATGAGGSLEETFWSGSSGGWSAWRSLGGSITNL